MKKKIKNTLYNYCDELGNVYGFHDNILVPKEDKYGYLTVKVRYKDKFKTKTIHRLVAETFIPRVPNKNQINHKDGNKHNNNIDNLEWCTPKENVRHAHRTGLHKGVRTKVYAYKDDHVYFYDSMTAFAKDIDVSCDKIYDKLKGTNKCHIKDYDIDIIRAKKR